jgi:hypothetical protein
MWPSRIFGSRSSRSSLCTSIVVSSHRIHGEAKSSVRIPRVTSGARRSRHRPVPLGQRAPGDGDTVAREHLLEPIPGHVEFESDALSTSPPKGGQRRPSQALETALAHGAITHMHPPTVVVVVDDVLVVVVGDVVVVVVVVVVEDVLDVEEVVVVLDRTTVAEASRWG